MRPARQPARTWGIPSERHSFQAGSAAQGGEQGNACRIISDIHLAGVKPRLQRAERQVKLKDSSFAVAGVQLGKLEDGTFEGRGFAAGRSRRL